MPIEIVSFPIKNGDFPIAMLVYQRVTRNHKSLTTSESWSMQSTAVPTWKGLAMLGAEAGPLPGSLTVCCEKWTIYGWFTLQMVIFHSNFEVLLFFWKMKIFQATLRGSTSLTCPCQALSTQPQICLPLSSANNLGGPGENHRDPGDLGDLLLTKRYEELSKLHFYGLKLMGPIMAQ